MRVWIDCKLHFPRWELQKLLRQQGLRLVIKYGLGKSNCIGVSNMGETLNLLFRRSEDGTFELQATESRSGRVVSGSFVPPYQTRQLNTLLKKLNTFESDDRELREIGQHLYQSLIGAATHGTDRRELSEQSFCDMFRGDIIGAMGRCGTVAFKLRYSQH